MSYTFTSRDGITGTYNKPFDVRLMLETLEKVKNIEILNKEAIIEEVNRRRAQRAEEEARNTQKKEETEDG